MNLKMAGLVGYASSDEEEEEIIEQKVTAQVIVIFISKFLPL